MLDTIRYYVSHTVIGSIAEGVSTILNAFDALINRVAVEIIQAIICAPLLYLHNVLFPVGVVIGFIFDKQVREIAQKVNVVYNAQRSNLERACLIAGIATFAWFTMPTTIVIATLYHSTQLGAFLYQSSLGRQPQQNPVTTAPAAA